MSNSPLVLTLDAGGTNFVFSALKAGKEVGSQIRIPAATHSEEACTNALIDGFEELQRQFDDPVECISFAFPGPANYRLGIIGNLPNFPGIRGNYPLKPLLEQHFKVPVLINNDGDLFALGEATSGFLPHINDQLVARGSSKRYSNLIGITLGTGIGCGLVFRNHLLTGDNSCGGEIHNIGNPNNTDWNLEESVSTRAIIREYKKMAVQAPDSKLMPRDIYDIAIGNGSGDSQAAQQSFKQFGASLGHAIADLVNLFDGLVVIGGGITSAWDLFAPSMFETARATFKDRNERSYSRTNVKIYDLNQQKEANEFFNIQSTIVQSEALKEQINYDAVPRTAIVRSNNDASVSISKGAYYIAASLLSS